MPRRAKYLLLIFFILMVLTAMFLIYSNINSEDKVVYFNQGEATWIEKVGCIIQGGAIESAPIDSLSVPDCVTKNKTDDCQSPMRYLCHYR